MKLSKAQQEVVDKMREGLRLYYLKHDNTCNLLGRSDNILVKKVSVNKLLFKGVIEKRSDDSNINEYQLTEKYRTNEQ